MEEQNIQNAKTEATAVQSEETKTVDESTSNVTKKPLLSGSALLTIGAVVIGILLVLVVFVDKQPNDSEVQVEVGATEYPEVVAVVNGEEISGADFSSAVSRTAFSATQQGVDVSDPAMQSEIESQSLDMLINTELLSQAAVAAGITVDETAVETRMSEIEAQFGGSEGFEAELVNLGLTVEQVREDVYADLLITTYLEQNESYEASVTDEDIQAAYEAYTTQGAQLPPLEEVAEVIEQQLVLEAEQAAISAIIETLRAEAEVEVNM